MEDNLWKLVIMLTIQSKTGRTKRIKTNNRLMRDVSEFIVLLDLVELHFS